MRSAAIAANRDWRAYEARCGQSMKQFVEGFISYCGISLSDIRFLRWDDTEQTYSESNDGMMYTLPGALKYDEKEGCWRLGLSITLTPAQWVAFGLTLTESEDGKWMVKAAGDKSPRQINFSDSNQCNGFYDEIVAKILAAFKTRKPGSDRIIGFNP